MVEPSRGGSRSVGLQADVGLIGKPTEARPKRSAWTPTLRGSIQLPMALVPRATVVADGVRGKLRQAKVRGWRQFATTLHVAKPVDIPDVRVHVADACAGRPDVEPTHQRDDRRGL
jgi:hypothetical protein